MAKSKRAGRGRSARDVAKRRAAEHKSGGGKDFLRTFNKPENASMIKVKSDDARRFDILEYEVTVSHNPWADKGDMGFERTYFSHRMPDPSSDKGYSSQLICPKKNFGKPCPICEYIANHDTDDEVESKRAKDYKLKERQLFNVVDLLEEDKGVQLFDYSYHTFGKKLDAELQNADEDDDFDTFPEHKGGKTLKIAWEEKSMGNTFYDATSINFKDRKKDYKNPKVFDLDTLLVLYSYDTLAGILAGEEVTLVEDTIEGGEAKKEAKPAQEEKKAEKKPEPKEEEPEKVETEEEPEPDTKEDDLEPPFDTDEDEAEAEADDAAEEGDEPAAEEEEEKEVLTEASGDDGQYADDECPHGHVFGVDNDKFDKDCDDCDDLCSNGKTRWEVCFATQRDMTK